MVLLCKLDIRELRFDIDSCSTPPVQDVATVGVVYLKALVYLVCCFDAHGVNDLGRMFIFLPVAFGGVIIPDRKIQCRPALTCDLKSASVTLRDN